MLCQLNCQSSCPPVQFSAKNITQDQTKYDYVVSALDIKSAEEVQGFLINPPETEKYAYRKKNFIKAFGKSQTQLDSELLNLSGLGDRKPTALLHKINSLNDDPATLKRLSFCSSSPPYVRCILAGQEFQDMETLVEAADRIWEAHCAGRTGIQQVTQAGVEASFTAVKERHFSLPAAPVKQPVTQSGHGVNHPCRKWIPLSSQL